MEIETVGTHALSLVPRPSRSAEESPAVSNVIAWPGRLPDPQEAAESSPIDDELEKVHLVRPPAVVSFAEVLTLRETGFFRDRPTFDRLKRRLFPRLVRARQGERRLRVWSAGCSTGQEAWSLAILLHDLLPPGIGWQIELLATDISSCALETAKRGSYRHAEMHRGLSEAQRRRFFVPDPDVEGSARRWRVRDELRRGINFRRHDLREPLHAHARSQPGEGFDLVLMRNVLLYMTPDERTAALMEVHRSMAPDGVLLLGALEQAEEFCDLFHAELDEACCFYRPVIGPRGAYWHSSTPWPGSRIE